MPETVVQKDAVLPFLTHTKYTQYWGAVQDLNSLWELRFVFAGIAHEQQCDRILVFDVGEQAQKAFLNAAAM